jgi:hypothetical protein
MNGHLQGQESISVCREETEEPLHGREDIFIGMDQTREAPSEHMRREGLL